MSGWNSDRPNRTEAKPKPEIVRPIGCDECRGRGHPAGWIQWDLYLGSVKQGRPTAVKCACNLPPGGTAGRPPLPPGQTCEETRYDDVSAEVVAKTDALMARMRDRADASLAEVIGGPETRRGQGFKPAMERVRGPG